MILKGQEASRDRAQYNADVRNIRFYLFIGFYTQEEADKEFFRAEQASESRKDANDYKESKRTGEHVESIRARRKGIIYQSAGVRKQLYLEAVKAREEREAAAKIAKNRPSKQDTPKK